MGKGAVNSQINLFISFCFTDENGEQINKTFSSVDELNKYLSDKENRHSQVVEEFNQIVFVNQYYL